MQPYKAFKPTPFDPAGAYITGPKSEWLVAPIGRTRDSERLDRSNWHIITTDLETKCGEESEENEWEIHSFGHWGPGWFEIIILRPDSPAHLLMQEWQRNLENYPVASEDHYSNLEYEETIQWWEDCGLATRVEYCQRAGVTPFAARHLDTIPEEAYEYVSMEH